MIRALILSFALCLAAHSQPQSVNVTSGSPSATLSGSPWSTIGSQPMRMEMRLHNWGSGNLPADPGGIVYLGGIELVSLISTQLQVITSHGMDAANSPTIIGCCSGKGDILVRIQRDTASGGGPLTCASKTLGCYTLEVVDLLSTYYASSSGDILSIGGNWSGRFNSINAGGKIAWIEWYDSVVPLGTVIPVADTATGNLGSYKFENNLVDGSGRGNTLTGGTVAYTDTPTYAPRCNPGVQATFRAGANATLSGSGLSLEPPFTLPGVAWQQIAGPAVRWISGQTSFTPTVYLPTATNNPAYPSYVFQLTVTDGTGASSSCTIKDGAVATDLNGVAITGNATVDKLLHQQMRWGANPWPWADNRRQAAWELQQNNVYNIGGPNGGPGCTSTDLNVCWFQDWWLRFGAGTILTFPDGTATITGSGTSWLTDFGCTVGNAPATLTTIAVEYGSAPFHYRMFQVLNCASNSQVTVEQNWDATLGNPTGRWAVDLGFVNSGQYGTSNANAQYNYYSNVSAFYAAYYATGIDDNLTAARTVADRIWQSPYIDQGNSILINHGSGWGWGFPRMWDVLGMVLRALDKGDSPPNGMWAGLRAFWQQDIFGLQFINSAYWLIGDVREDGFRAAGLGLCAQFDPGYFDAYDGETCGTAISTIMSSQTTYWTDANGAVVQLYGNIGSFATPPDTPQTATATNGQSTATCHDGTSICNWAPALPSGSLVWFLNNGYPQSPHGAPLSNAAGDSVNYVLSAATASTYTMTSNYAGTTAANKGWLVFDHNASNTPLIGFGAQVYMEGIMGDGLSRIADSVAISDPTASAKARSLSTGAAQWIRNLGWQGSTIGAYWYALGMINCPVIGTPTVSSCDGFSDIDTQRTENVEAMLAPVDEFIATGNTAAKTNADAAYNAIFAKPGTCPNGSTVCNSDGHYVSGLDDGQTYMAWGGVLLPWKWFGLFWGVSLGPSWPAVRVGGLAPAVTGTVYAQFTMASVPGTTSVVIAYIDTTGVTSSTTCTATPCAVTIPRNDQATIQLTYSYKSSGGATLLKSVVPMVVSQ